MWYAGASSFLRQETYAVGFRPASEKRTPLPCTVHHRHRRRCDRPKVRQKDHLAVKNNVFCRHQRTAIMPRIEIAFECMILFCFTFTFEIRYYKYWSGSTYNTFYKNGCLSVQNIPPRQVLFKFHQQCLLAWQLCYVRSFSPHRTCL